MSESIIVRTPRRNGERAYMLAVRAEAQRRGWKMFGLEDGLRRRRANLRRYTENMAQANLRSGV